MFKSEMAATLVEYLSALTPAKEAITTLPQKIAQLNYTTKPLKDTPSIVTSTLNELPGENFYDV